MKDFSFDELMDDSQHSSSMSFIANIEGTKHEVPMVETDELIPILPVRNVMLFPMSIMPISIGRKPSLELVKEASASNAIIGLFSQNDDMIESPTENDLYHTGCLARVLRVITLPDNSYVAVIQGYTRARLIDIDASGSYLKGHVETYPEDALPSKHDKQFKALISTLKDVALKCMQADNPSGALALENINDPEIVVNFIASNINITNKERIVLLEMNSIIDRADKLLTHVNKQYQFVSLKRNIQMRTREALNKQQRDYFLRQEIQNIQQELGEGSEEGDIAELRAKSETMDWNDDTKKAFEKCLSKLGHMNAQSPEYQTEYQYAQTILSLPWRKCTKDNLNIKTAERILNKDHYGMEKVKERILEHLAVLKLRGDFKSPIICLYGPPGVGKTSLGKSIAKAMNRNYVRVSLGGIHDESEIRGHRRTYIGAMPGRIIKNLAKAGSSNPVFILDEIDKVVAQQTANGDPASALLEVLDPEQNEAFHDNYLDLDYDLSKVMFIATANNVGAIPAPLLDRMELIEVSGYLTEEKMAIAKQHLLPKNLENLGMTDSGIKISKQGFEKIIESYTRESGVRNLDKQINKVLRKIALESVREGQTTQRELSAADIKTYLGPEPYNRDKYQGNEYAGVVTGLAWTAVGGEILFIETSLSKGKGGKLTLTGNLGDVMKESAVLALEYLKAHCDMLNINSEIFNFWNIHIHVPEGATPKDGPSAGITIATSLASALTQRKVRKNIAMTGEITLRGKVLPVGGIKEKILAAKRAGITDILICHENRKDIEQIPEKYVKGLTFHYVDKVKDVLDFALLDEKISNPVDLEAAIEKTDSTKQ